MENCATLEVLRKFCNNIEPGATGNSLADDLTLDLIEAIRKDIVANDFTPAEIADLRPVSTGPPRNEFSPAAPSWSRIRELVTEFRVFTRADYDHDHWLASMDTDKNMEDWLFSDVMEITADEIEVEMLDMGGGDWISLMAMRAIENVWRRAKISSPRYYICHNGEIDYMVEVTNEGSKKVIHEY